MRVVFILKTVSLLILVIIILILSVLLKTNNNSFEYFDNQEGHLSPLVPNIVHYVIFDKSTIDFITFLSITSVLKIHQPEAVWVHCNRAVEASLYWGLLQQLSNHSKVQLEMRALEPPRQVFGQPLSSVFHSSDVARILLLINHGGIYLDTDVLVLKPLDKFLYFEMVVGWPTNQYFGNQVLIGHKDARFLSLWLAGYRVYKPRMWYYNAGQYPTEQLLEKWPELVHRERESLGVHNLLKELYLEEEWDWSRLYTVHLLARHPPAPQGVNETSLAGHNTTFGRMARWLLFGLRPALDLTWSPPRWKHTL